MRIVKGLWNALTEARVGLSVANLQYRRGRMIFEFVKRQVQQCAMDQGAADAAAYAPGRRFVCIHQMAEVA